MHTAGVQEIYIFCRSFSSEIKVVSTALIKHSLAMRVCVCVCVDAQASVFFFDDGASCNSLLVFLLQRGLQAHVEDSSWKRNQNVKIETRVSQSYSIGECLREVRCTRTLWLCRSSPHSLDSLLAVIVSTLVSHVLHLSCSHRRCTHASPICLTHTIDAKA